MTLVKSADGAWIPVADEADIKPSMKSVMGNTSGPGQVFDLGKLPRLVVPPGEVREHFDTGSQRDSREGKGRYDLESLIARRWKALVAESGAQHYGDRNWEKGQPLMRYYDSAARHMAKWASGEDIDPDSGLPHLAHAAWNIDAALHTAELIRAGHYSESLDDRPTYAGRTLKELGCT